MSPNNCILCTKDEETDQPVCQFAATVEVEDDYDPGMHPIKGDFSALEELCALKQKDERELVGATRVAHY